MTQDETLKPTYEQLEKLCMRQQELLMAVNLPQGQAYPVAKRENHIDNLEKRIIELESALKYRDEVITQRNKMLSDSINRVNELEACPLCVAQKRIEELEENVNRLLLYTPEYD